MALDWPDSQHVGGSRLKWSHLTQHILPLLMNYTQLGHWPAFQFLFVALHVTIAYLSTDKHVEEKPQEDGRFMAKRPNMNEPPPEDYAASSSAGLKGTKGTCSILDNLASSHDSPKDVKPKQQATFITEEAPFDIPDYFGGEYKGMNVLLVCPPKVPLMKMDSIKNAMGSGLERSDPDLQVEPGDANDSLVPNNTGGGERKKNGGDCGRGGGSSWEGGGGHGWGSTGGAAGGSNGDGKGNDDGGGDRREKNDNNEGTTDDEDKEEASDAEQEEEGDPLHVAAEIDNETSGQLGTGSRQTPSPGHLRTALGLQGRWRPRTRPAPGHRVLRVRGVNSADRRRTGPGTLCDTPAMMLGGRGSARPRDGVGRSGRNTASPAGNNPGPELAPPDPPVHAGSSDDNHHDVTGYSKVRNPPPPIQCQEDVDNEQRSQRSQQAPFGNVHAAQAAGGHGDNSAQTANFPCRQSRMCPLKIRVVVIAKCEEDVVREKELQIMYAQEENRRLQARYLCHLCRRDRFSLVFDPCGHLACDHCGLSLTRCFCGWVIFGKHRASFGR